MIVFGATKGLPKSVRDRWTKLQGDLIQTAAWGDHIIAQDTGHVIHQERPEQVADAVIRVVGYIRQGST